MPRLMDHHNNHHAIGSSIQNLSKTRVLNGQHMNLIHVTNLVVSSGSCHRIKLRSCT